MSTITKPVKNGRISSRYGYRVNPFYPSEKEFHPGIDIVPIEKNTHPEILNVWKSYISIVGKSDTFGNRVWVKLLEGEHTGLFMVYAHLDKINPDIKMGMTIPSGMVIGWMGSTGLSTGIHTHLEIRPNPSKPGNSINPIEITNLYK